MATSSHPFSVCVRMESEGESWSLIMRLRAVFMELWIVTDSTTERMGGFGFVPCALSSRAPRATSVDCVAGL